MNANTERSAARNYANPRTLKEGVDRIRKDLQQEKEDAHESRAVIYRRLDDHVKQMAKTDETIAIAGYIDAQIRNEVKALQETVQRNH